MCLGLSDSNDLDDHVMEWTLHSHYMRYICLVIATPQILSTPGFCCMVDYDTKEEKRMSRLVGNLSPLTEAFIRSVVCSTISILFSLNLFTIPIFFPSRAISHPIPSFPISHPLLPFLPHPILSHISRHDVQGDRCFWQNLNADTNLASSVANRIGVLYKSGTSAELQFTKRAESLCWQFYLLRVMLDEGYANKDPNVVDQPAILAAAHLKPSSLKPKHRTCRHRVDDQTTVVRESQQLELDNFDSVNMPIV